jgi:two-component system phosphate regulon response regulator PhoB
MQKKQIVVVEDEPDILEVLCYNLKREGYQVYESLDGLEGLNLIEQKIPDIVILDLMLPGIDGLEICKKIKSNKRTQHVPIIMVTAKGEESDVVLGLGMGADDYIPKPFSPKELIARVKAVLRRGEQLKDPSENESIEIDGLRIDANKHQVSIDGISIKMTASEFRLLFCLASRPGQVFTREQLLNHTTSEEVVAVVDRNIDVHIRSIRKKIGGDRSYIETIRGVGYRFLDH